MVVMVQCLVVMRLDNLEPGFGYNLQEYFTEFDLFSNGKEY